ncbi:hypothetical protein FQN54_000099 [Arachnomyces sp. PD_36]|nr:hypothetical protein FQN54_000099 [Arachnomyces sp. PD_36]
MSLANLPSARRSSMFALSLFLVALVLVIPVVGDHITDPISVYKSRPDLFSPTFKVEFSQKEKLAPGLIFVGPYEIENSGPFIYDMDGVGWLIFTTLSCCYEDGWLTLLVQNLVWNGWGVSGPPNAHAPHVCNYKGEDHLCFFQGIQQKGFCRGHGVIMDNQYRIVRSIQPGGGITGSDMHEFKLLDEGKTALLTVYQQRQFDMSAWNVTSGIGFIVESIFQEVDVESGKVIFEWKSLDHVHPRMSYTLPATTDTSGDGRDPHSPWDYFHINSIDKNEEGDYLISSRHTSCIYKLSGKDGSIIWRLNGAKPSFKNTNFGFSQQHDARWISENKTHTVLSLYNNGSNGFNVTHTYSAGMIIEIDHTSMTATKVREYAPPGKSMSSSSQGNLQLLPNNNVMMGWGNNAYVSEHDEEGNLLFWGWLSTGRMMNYRAQKFHWIADPTDIPALWTYANSEKHESQLTLYVSWNGATKVRKWKFYCSQDPDGPFTAFEPIPKQGFETTVVNPHFFPWCYVVALDKDGEELAKSSLQKTFVPSPKLRNNCVDEVCGNAQLLGENDSDDDYFEDEDDVFAHSPAPEDEEEEDVPPPPPPPADDQDFNDPPPEQGPEQNPDDPPPPPGDAENDPPPQDNIDNPPPEGEAVPEPQDNNDGNAGPPIKIPPSNHGNHGDPYYSPEDNNHGINNGSSSFKQYGDDNSSDYDDEDDDAFDYYLQEETNTDSISSLTDRIWWILSVLAVCAASVAVFVWMRRRRDGGSGDAGTQMNGSAREAEELEGLVNGEVEGKAGVSSAGAWGDGSASWWPWSWVRGRERSQSYYALPTRNLDESREAFD